MTDAPAVGDEDTTRRPSHHRSTQHVTPRPPCHHRRSTARRTAGATSNSNRSRSEPYRSRSNPRPRCTRCASPPFGSAPTLRLTPTSSLVGPHQWATATPRPLSRACPPIGGATPRYRSGFVDPRQHRRPALPDTLAAPNVRSQHRPASADRTSRLVTNRPATQRRRPLAGLSINPLWRAGCRRASARWAAPSLRAGRAQRLRSPQ